MAVKDEVDVAGQPCTEGSLILKDHVADHTAACIQRIIDAGGIIHARSATPEFCCAAITDSRSVGRHPQPVEPRLQSGRLVRRLRSRPRRRHGQPGHRVGHRRLDPHPRLVLRGRRVQAALRPRAPGRRPSTSTTTATTAPWPAPSRTAACSRTSWPGRIARTSSRCGPSSPSRTSSPGVDGWKIAVSPDLGGFDVTARGPRRTCASGRRRVPRPGRRRSRTSASSSPWTMCATPRGPTSPPSSAA